MAEDLRRMQESYDTIFGPAFRDSRETIMGRARAAQEEVIARIEQIKPPGFYAAQDIRAQAEEFNASLGEGQEGVAVVYSNVGPIHCKVIEWTGSHLVFNGFDECGRAVRHLTHPSAASVSFIAIEASEPSDNPGIGLLWSAGRGDSREEAAAG